MRNRPYLCIVALLATTVGAAAQAGSGCVAGDANPSSINAGCSAGGLPSVSQPLPDNGSALDAGTTSSVTGTTAPGAQSNMPALEVPSLGAETGAGGSMTGGARGNADISGSTSTNNRIGGSAITGTSGISAGSSD